MDLLNDGLVAGECADEGDAAESEGERDDPSDNLFKCGPPDRDEPSGV